MLRGLTTAASGMIADERVQQMLSNNLANSETPGFKTSDGALLSFPEQLIRMMDYGQNGGSAIGKLDTGVVYQEGVPLFAQGQLQDTHRNLDVAIVDGTPAGTYAAVAQNPGQATPVQSIGGMVQAGAGGRLEINGQPVAVVNPQGSSIPNVFAARNPAYQGSALYAADGRPDYDTNGNPSYVFVNGSGAVVGQAGQRGWEGASLRIGTEKNMGLHSFYAVAYSSPEVPSGLALTRDGHFDVDSQNVLVDASGHPVLPIGQNGLPIQNGRIVINAAYTGTDLFGPDGGPVTDAKGQPSYRVLDTNGNVINGKLGTVDADVTQVSPLGQTEFEVGGSLNPAQAGGLLRPTSGSLKDLTERLPEINPDLANRVKEILEYHKSIRHLRGGEATKLKYNKDMVEEVEVEVRNSSKNFETRKGVSSGL